MSFITLVDTTMTGNSSVTYSTFFGGTGSDTGFGIQADGNGNAYVVGTTASPDFPITPFVLPSSLPNPFGSPFVVKLSPKGNGTADRIYASYFGGSGDGNPNDPDQGNAIAIDSHGNAYITGVDLFFRYADNGGCVSDCVERRLRRVRGKVAADSACGCVTGKCGFRNAARRGDHCGRKPLP